MRAHQATFLLLAFFCAVAPGCQNSGFYVTAPALGVTEARWDDTLLAAVDEVFDECANPIVLEPGDEQLDLFPQCASAPPETMSDDGAFVYSLATLMLDDGVLDLYSPLPDEEVFETDVPLLHFHPNDSTILDPLNLDLYPDWADVDCEMHVVTTLVYQPFVIENLWTSWHPDEAIEIHVLPAHVVHAVDATIAIDVNCADPADESELQVLVDLIHPHPDVPIPVDLVGVEVIDHIAFDTNGFDIWGSGHVDVIIEDLEVSQVLVDLANVVGVTDAELLEDVTGLSIGAYADSLGALLEPGLVNVPSGFSLALQSSVPADHVICRLEGDWHHLSIYSDPISDPHPCMMAIPAPWPPHVTHVPAPPAPPTRPPPRDPLRPL